MDARIATRFDAKVDVSTRTKWLETYTPKLPLLMQVQQ